MANGRYGCLTFSRSPTLLKDLPRLASYRLHKLAGDRAGQWSLTINLPWVVCFTPDKDGGWRDVEITDYH